MEPWVAQMAERHVTPARGERTLPTMSMASSRATPVQVLRGSRVADRFRRCGEGLSRCNAMS